MAIQLLRERAIEAIQAQARLEGRDSDDRRWSRGQAGFRSATTLIGTLAAERDESLDSWLTHALVELERTRDLGPDDDDERWFASAVDEARRILVELGGLLLRATDADLAQFGRLVRRGDRFVAFKYAGELTVFEGNTRRDLGRFGPVDQFWVSPDGCAAFIQHQSRLVHVDLETGATKADDPFGQIRCYAACDAFVIAGSYVSDFLKIWNWRGDELPNLAVEHADPTMDFGTCALAITPDGRWLAVADKGEDREGGGFTSLERGESPTVRLYDMQSRTCVGRRALYTYELSISSDGTVITTENLKLRAPDLTSIDAAAPAGA